MQPYQPSNIVPRSGLLKMALAICAGGAAIGGTTFLISLFFYLMMLFPIGMGTVSGLLSRWAVISGKVRYPLAAGCSGLLVGISSYATYRGLEYLTFARSMTPATMTLSSSPALSWPAYLAMEAKRGASVLRIGRGGLQNLGETGTWCYWLVELAIIQYLAFSLPRAAATAAFSERANSWYDHKVRFGNIEPAVADSFLELMKEQKLTAAGALLNTHIKKVEAGSLEVYVKTAGEEGAQDVMLSINSTTVNRRGKLQLQEVATGILSPSDYQEFTATTPNPIENFTSADVLYRAHDLSIEQVAEIVQQFTAHPSIQAAYLLKMVSIKSVPVIDTYQIGIIFDRQQIATDQQKQELLEQLSSEIEIPGEAYVTLLNNDARSLYAIRQIVTQPVYHKQV
jgi:hypothetical protein